MFPALLMKKVCPNVTLGEGQASAKRQGYKDVEKGWPTLPLPWSSS